MGGVLGGVASLGGAIIGANASKSAAKSQVAAADAATAEQRRQYDQTRQDMLPFYQSGIGANQQLAYLLGINPGNVEGGASDPYSGVNKNIGDFGSLSKSFGMEDFQQDPGYSFRLSEGQKALERSAASRGMLNSGATMKAALRYGQDMGSQEFQNAYNRYNNDKTTLYNRLAGISGSGQNTANTLASVGQNTANNIGNNIIGAGNARAAGTMGAANAWTTGLNNIAGSFNSFGGGGASLPYGIPSGSTQIYNMPWLVG